MNFLQQRKYKKVIKHMMHEARHARNMRLDVAEQKDLDALTEAQEGLDRAWETRDKETVDQAREDLYKAIGKVYPTPTSPRARERVEIIAVALIVAWALRTYFIQPFKIPTGSMEPTLFGISVHNEAIEKKNPILSFPEKALRYLIKGEKDVKVRCKVNGVVEHITDEDDHGRRWIQVRVNPPPDQPIDPDRKVKRVMYKIPSGKFHLNAWVKQPVTNGHVFCEGRMISGDHIFVDKVRYNFSRPELGDIFVFSTEDLKHPNIKTNQYYIKRLAGLPGNKVAIKTFPIKDEQGRAVDQTGYLYINDQRVLEPPPFKRVAESREENYKGYAHAARHSLHILGENDDFIQLGEADYLPLGDNSPNSLDGKYFGAIKEEKIVGPAFAIYWPFSKRWGWTK